jgi:hypothetical protein
VPTPSRRHPLPATAVANADGGGEEWEVVLEVMEAIKMREVVPWKERAMVECMYASPSPSHAKVVWPAEAMDGAKALHPSEAMHAARTVHAPHHRVGRHHWRCKHRHYDSASSRYFAEHDNPPDRHRLPPAL